MYVDIWLAVFRVLLQGDKKMEQGTEWDSWKLTYIRYLNQGPGNTTSVSLSLFDQSRPIY